MFLFKHFAKMKSRQRNTKPQRIGRQHRNNPKRKSAQGEKDIILSRTIMFTDLPAWIQRDEHIGRGYHISGKSVPEYVQSLGYLHNEIVNI